MPKLPSSADYPLRTPQAASRLVDVPFIRQEPDLATGEAMKQIGAAGFRFADALKQETDKLDTLKAQEALTKIQQARLDLTMGEKGAYQAKGGDVLTPTYASGFKSQFDTFVAGVMDGLTPAQRMKLTPHAQREGIGFQTDIARHSMAQAEAYKKLVQEGQAAVAVNVGIAQRGDPVAFSAEVAKLDALAMSTARNQGLTGATDAEKDTIIAIRQKLMSPVYAGAITGLLDDRNVERARALLTEGRLVIDPATRLKLTEQVTKAEEDKQVLLEAGAVLKTVQAANTTEGRVASVLRATPLSLAAATRGVTTAESGAMGANGGMTQADGTIIKGPVIQSGPAKGQQAIGPHQFLVATAKEAAARAGLPWDEKLFYGTSEVSRKYHDRLQEAHVSKLMSMFDTQAEVFAAYNAGEGNVVKAKEKFAKVQKLISMGVAPVLPGGYNAEKDGPLSFLDFLPKPSETKPYVARAIAAAAAAPDVVRPAKQDIQVALTAKFPGRPDLVKAAGDVIERNLSLQEDARKKEIADTKESAYKLMGQGKAFIELPPSLLAKLPVRDQDEVRKTFEDHTKGAPRDSNQGLLRQINSDPDYVARVPPEVWEGPIRTQLSEYDYARFTKQRAARLGGEVKEAETLDDGTVNRALAMRLRFLGIDPTPKENDSKGMALVNSTRAVIDQSILARQRQLNRRMTDVEITQHVDTMFRADVQLRNTFLGITLGSPESVSILSMSYSDIPGDAVDAIEADLKKQGIAKPTDMQVLAIYKQTKLGLR